MLQRQLMLKQLQELQKHQQFPGIAEGRQQNQLNQQSAMFMPANTSFMPHDSSAAFQGFPNGSFLQTQMQDHFLSLPSVNQNISPDPHSFADGAFQFQQFPNGQNIFGQVHNEGFQQMNTSSQKFNSMQEQTGVSEHFQGKITKSDHSQGATTLDPLEQKILFSMDDDSCISSFGRNTDGYTNTSEGSDYLSLSALMQSAAAESSSDTGVVQEEWSGLSFQTTELSMDNQPSNNADVGDQHNNWVDNNVMPSLSGKPQAPFCATDLRPGFSGFQYPDKQRGGTRSDSSHESAQGSPEVPAKWLNFNYHQGQAVKGSQPDHKIQPPPENVFPFPGFQLPDDNSEQRGTFAKLPDQTSSPTSFGPSMEPMEPRKQQGNHNVTSASVPVNTRNQHQENYPSSAAINTRSSQTTLPNMTKKRPPFDLFIPRDVSQSSLSHDQGGEQFPILESVPVESSRKPPNLWQNALPQTHPSAKEPRELPSVWQFSSNPVNTNIQALPGVSQDRHGQKKFEGNLFHESGAGLTNPQGLISGVEHHRNESVSQISPQSGSSNGLEPVANHPSEDIGFGSGILNGNPHQGIFGSAHGGDTQVSFVSERDLEAFGRSLKPSNLSPNTFGASGINHELGSVTNPSTSMFMNPYAFGDVNTQSIKPSHLPLPQNNAEEMEPQGSSFSCTDIKPSAVAFHGTDHSQINNMQMASWYKQYGELRNDQMLSMHDRAANHSIHPSPLGKYVEKNEMKTSIVPLDVAGDSRDAEKLPSLSTSPLDLENTDLSMTRSRKRKTATSELLPWHTEVSSSTRLKSVSLAEIEWTKAVNRLSEKVDYEVSTTEHVHPLRRPKKRLALTTQLMQMVFTPAPAAILRANSLSNYDAVTYFSAKLALGEACNLSSWSRSGSGLPTSDIKMIEESKSSLEVSEKRYSIIVEAFTSRAKKLEADFEKLEADSLRLDKATSFSDITVERKELEKFSIINRFAKFHIRGKSKSGETSTSSNSATSVPNIGPQRYVRAFTARALPVNAQCLAL